MIVNLLGLGAVKPELVEGPKVMFYIPCPESFPFAESLGNGSFGLPVTITIVTTWAIMLGFFLLFHFGMKKMELKPKKKQVFFELLYSVYDALVTQSLGKWKKKYLYYIGTLITFIFVSNIISFFPIPGFTKVGEQIQIVPLFRSPTADLNTTLGLALITCYMFLSAAMRTGGIVGYIKGLMQPNPVMLPMNLIGELAKPVNISMRLFGNMFAGMVIMGLLYMAAPAALPAPLHLYFDLFSGLVQSFVFTMLTMVYIQGELGDSEPEVV